jgi:hypothetical protein
MNDRERTNLDGPAAGGIAPKLPATADRATFQAGLDRLRVREKAHTREGDAIAAARRRLPMVEVDADLALIGPGGPLTPWEDSPPGWTQEWRVDGSNTRTGGRPIAQWSRLEAGRSDDLRVSS